MEITKQDWSLFRSRLPVWQENYMAYLLKGYAQLLACGKDASDIFWELDQRMRRDKKSPGVQLSPSKSDLPWILAKMLQDGVINDEDLNEFSEDMISAVKLILSR